MTKPVRIFSMPSMQSVCYLCGYQARLLLPPACNACRIKRGEPGRRSAYCTACKKYGWVFSAQFQHGGMICYTCAGEKEPSQPPLPSPVVEKVKELLAPLTPAPIVCSAFVGKSRFCPCNNCRED